MSTTPSAASDAGPADIDWQALAARAHDDARLSFGYLALMIMAAVLAAIAILTDSVVMLIGAMIIAPDFGPIAGVSIGATSRR